MGWIKIEPKPHRCATPERRERKRVKCERGSIWQCDDCGKQWIWRGGYDGLDWFTYSPDKPAMPPPPRPPV